MPNVFNQSANALTQAIRGTNRAGNNLGFAPQLSNTNLQPYMNPYTQNVIDNTMNTLDRQRNQMLNQVGAQATAAGAFGGSRHGLVEAETNRGFADTMASTTAGLNQANFNNAQQMGLADINNRINQNQFNTNTQLNAANQLGNLSNLGFGMGTQVQQMQNEAGGQQQAINQALIDAARGQYGQWQGQPQQGLSGLIAALGGAPNQSTTTQSSNPGLLGMLSGGASILGSLGLCWISRAAFGADNPEWLNVRKWMLLRAPKWLFDGYVKHGPRMAEWIERHPISKPFFRAALRQMIKV